MDKKTDSKTEISPGCYVTGKLLGTEMGKCSSSYGAGVEGAWRTRFNNSQKKSKGTK